MTAHQVITEELIQKLRNGEQAGDIITSIPKSQYEQFFKELQAYPALQEPELYLQIGFLLKYISEKLENQAGLCFLLYDLAFRYFWSGRFSEAEPYYSAYFSQIFKENDILPMDQIIGQACRLSAMTRSKGYQEVTSGNPEGAEKIFHLGLAILALLPESARSSHIYLYEQAQLLDALNCHREAREIYDTLISQHPEMDIIALYRDRASTLVSLGMFPEACDDLRIAAQLAEGQGDYIRAEAVEYMRASLLFTKMGESVQARDIIEGLIKKTRQDDLRSDLYYMLGTIQIDLGKYHQSIESFTAAKQYYETSGDTRSSYLMTEAIASSRSICGDYDEAIQLYSSCVAYYTGMGDISHELSAKWQLAISTIDKGDIFGGLQNLNMAISLAEELGQYLMVVRFCNTAAVDLFYYLHNYELANQYLEKAISICVQYPDIQFEYISALVNQAQYYIQSGFYQKAMENFDLAEEKCKNPPDLQSLAKINASRAELYAIQHSYESAIQFQSQAIAYYQEGNLKRFETDGLSSLSTIYLNGAQYHNQEKNLKISENYFEQAISTCNQAQNGYREMGASDMVFQMSNKKSTILALQGNVAAAESELMDLLKRDDINHSKTMAFSTYLGIGGIKCKIHDYAAAVPYLEKAYTISEEIRASLPFGSFRISFQSQETSLHDALIQCYVHTGDSKRLFQISEQAKSRVLSEGISLGRIASPSSLDPGLLKQEDELLRDMRGLIHEGNNITALHHTRQKLSATWDKMAEKYGSDPKVRQYLSLRRGTADYQGLLRTLRQNNPDTVLLSYYILKDMLIIQVLTPQDPDPVVVQVEVPEMELRKRTDQFLQYIAEKDHEYTGILNLLSDWLIRPVAGYLPEKGDLIIIPHKILHSFPFHGLILGDRPLVEDYSLSYTPSVSVFTSIKERSGGLGSGALIIAETADLLQFSPVEGGYIASLTSSVPVPLEQCTPSHILPLLSTSTIVSFACHAQYQPADAEGSQIILPGNKKRKIDAYDIFGISMVADLVSLSCCQTAKSKESPGDEQIGLIRAFLYAGAKSVLASLWNVNDCAGSLLIMRFFKNLLVDHLTTATALSHAQRSIRNMTREQLQIELQQIRQSGYEIPLYDELMEHGAYPFRDMWLWAPMALYGAR